MLFRSFILNAGYDVIKTEIKDKIFLRNMVLVIFICLVSIYFSNSCKQVDQRCRYFREKVKRNEAWLQTASWIKKDSMGLPKRAKIMACSDNYLSYLTDSDYIRLPFVILDWNKVINFAVLKKVNYIVIFGGYNLYSFLTFSEDEFRKPMTAQALTNAIKTGSTIMDRAGVPATATPIEALNKLLEYRDLYQLVPVWPVESIKFIHQLKEGKDFSFVELKQLDRILIELNYPKETPHKLTIDFNTNTGSGRIKMIHEIDVNDNIFWIFKI